MVHRDLKPANVLVDRAGQVKLLDFGIARLIDAQGSDSAPTAITREGTRALTPDFAAPEQLRGDAVTTAADVYALGVMLYLLLAGRHPTAPAGAGLLQVMHATLEAEPVPLDAAWKASAARRTPVPNAVGRMQPALPMRPALPKQPALPKLRVAAA